MGLEFSDEKEGALTAADIEHMYCWPEGYFNEEDEWVTMAGIPVDTSSYPASEPGAELNVGDREQQETQELAQNIGGQEELGESLDPIEAEDDNGFPFPEDDDLEEEDYQVEDVANWIGPDGTWT